MNDLGRVVFSAQVSGSGVTAGNDTGIWTGSSPLTLSQIVREGDNAVGTSIPTTFADFSTHFAQCTAFNNAGQIGLNYVPLNSGTNSAGFQPCLSSLKGRTTTMRVPQSVGRPRPVGLPVFSGNPGQYKRSYND